MALDLDKRSKVKNLCPWAITFTLPNSGGEVRIEGKKSTTINNGELVTMSDNNDIMLCGTGGGNHARLYVDNEEFRKYVGFDNEESKTKQFILIEEECEKICNLKQDSAFKRNVESKIVMEHEKSIFLDYCKTHDFNDYKKIMFLEEYTGMKMN